jgi:hypothetical protein
MREEEVKAARSWGEPAMMSRDNYSRLRLSNSLRLISTWKDIPSAK